MAAKTTTQYEANDGSVHSLLLDQDRFAAAGTPTTNAIDSPIKAQISKGNKEFGLRPRGVRLARLVGAPPDTFRKYTFLPVLTIADYNSAGFAIGASISIGGVAWEVVGKVPEDY